MRLLHPRFILAAILLIFVTGLNPGAGALEDARMAIFDAKISPDGNSVAFTWTGDIWIADINTGECRRITDHVAYDWHPVWFPDGRKIAFSSRRDGNDDVYSVPIGGGTPTRHTWFGNYDVPMDVSPDGRTILLRSYRRIYSSDLYEVDLNGGLPRPITNDQGINREATYSHNGNTILVSRGGTNWTRRRYSGSNDTNLYLMDRSGQNMRWIENTYNGIDYWPNWGPHDDYIYFVSDRSGMENAFRIPSSGGTPQQLTDFTDRPVFFLSVADTGRMAFVQNFRLWVMDPHGEPRIINLDCSSEPKHSQEVRLDIGGQVSEIEISPTGQFLAMIARGELYLSNLRDPSDTPPLGDQRFWEAIRITETQSREQEVSWHPHGDRVVLVSDRDGNREIYEINLRNFEWTRITDTPEEEYWPSYSPDGKWLAFFRGKSSFIARNTETGEDKTLISELLIVSPWPPAYYWSPDSRWIAYNAMDATEEADIFVVKIDGTCDIQNITLHHDDDYLRGWSDDGKNIYFLSSRGQEYGINGWGTWNRGYSLYNIPLLHEQPPRSDVLEFPEEPESENASPTDENPEEISEELPEVKIDFRRIDERARLVSPTRGGGYYSRLSPDGKTFVYDSNALGTSALWSVPFEGGTATKIADIPQGLDDLEWMPDGSGVIYLTGSRIFFWNKSNVSSVPAYGRLTLNLSDERVQMISETGRILRDHFYDPNMHMTDWTRAVDFYTPFIRQAAVPEEFATLMNMLFGELNASHLGCYTADSNEGIGLSTGFLGLDFDACTTGHGLQVTRVISRGPADYDESRINVGEWVLEINGTPVSTAMNYWALLDDTVDRTTVLRVASNQHGADAREVSLAPVSWSGGNPLTTPYYNMLYMDWVEQNRAVVDSRSDNRIGYVHIPIMYGDQLEQFARDLYSENYRKEALIIDVRFNSGGNIHEQLLDILSRPQFAWAGTRDDELRPQPSQLWDRPMVLLINEDSFSDAEIFPAGFRALGLGTIIGETTAGGVIGTWNISLVDGVTVIRIPKRGWYTMDHQNMENLGIEPDIRVVQDLNHIRDGIDDQLNYAVRYLLDRI